MLAPVAAAPVAWMKTPSWCRPADGSYAGLLLKKLGKTELFKSHYANPTLVERVARLFARIISVFWLTQRAVLDFGYWFLAPLNEYSWRGKLQAQPLKGLIASLALPIIGIGMVFGYLPRYSQKRVIYDALSAADIYMIVSRKREKKKLVDDNGEEAAQVVTKLCSRQYQIDETLVLAASCGAFKAVEMLLKEAKANPNAVVKGCSVLVYAAANCDPIAVKLLLMQGADPSWTAGGGLNALTAFLLHVTVRHPWAPFEVKKASSVAATARELVLGEVLFKNAQVETISQLFDGLRDNEGIENERHLHTWMSARKAEFQTLGENNPFYAFLKDKVLPFPPYTPTDVIADEFWEMAFQGIAKIPQCMKLHIKEAMEALFSTKKEVIWNRKEAIIKACPWMPESGIPEMISEYCYC